LKTGDLPAPFRLIGLDSVGSTNDEARRLADGGEALDFLVVTAATQTAGRGRRGRTWQSPPGNLHASVLLRRTASLADCAQLGFVCALAVAEGLETLAPHADVRCKWPNDVLLDGAKIAGLLLESAGDWLVLGFGVNIAHAPPPGEALYAATALAEAGYGGDVAQVLGAICARLGPWVGIWRDLGFDPVRGAWLGRAKGLGEPAIVRLEAETLSGSFKGLDRDGALILDQPGRGERRILAGDVFFPGS
jgi:BirA family biotin operon repressor/biotin-[acetyl-CoA-carboxylase] ligase